VAAAAENLDDDSFWIDEMVIDNRRASGGRPSVTIHDPADHRNLEIAFNCVYSSLNRSTSN